MQETKQYFYKKVEKYGTSNCTHYKLPESVIVGQDYWKCQLTNVLSLVDNSISSSYEAVLDAFYAADDFDSTDAGHFITPNPGKIGCYLPEMYEVTGAHTFTLKFWEQPEIRTNSLLAAWALAFSEYAFFTKSEVNGSYDYRNLGFTITGQNEFFDFLAAEVIFERDIETPIVMRWVTF